MQSHPRKVCSPFSKFLAVAGLCELSLHCTFSQIGCDLVRNAKVSNYIGVLLKYILITCFGETVHRAQHVNSYNVHTNDKCCLFCSVIKSSDLSLLMSTTSGTNTFNYLNLRN